MAYKFQIGDARLGGNLVQEGSMSGSTTLGIQAATVTSLNAQGGGISNAGAIAGATTVAMNGALSGVSTIAASGLATIGSLKVDDNADIGCDSDPDLLQIRSGKLRVRGELSASAGLSGLSLDIEKGADFNSSGLTNVGSVAGVSSLDGSGDLTMGTITMTGFSVDADGDTNLKTLAVDNGSTIGSDSDADMLTMNGGVDITVAPDLDFKLAAGKLKLGGTAVTATAAELNYLDNDDLSAARIGYLAGVTAGTAAASKALVLDADGKIATITQLTASYISGVSGQFTDLTVSANSLTIGSTTLNETEMAYIDGLTAGTVAASKAVVVDSNKDITGFRNVTATGYFEIGSAQLTEAELELLDGITAGTAAASKVLTADASANVDASALTFTNLGAVTTVDINGGSVDGASIGAASPATLTGSTFRATGASQMDGALRLQGTLTMNDNADIGIASDTDLMKLSSGQLRVRGSVRSDSFITGSGIIQGLSLDVEKGADFNSGGLTAVGSVAGATSIDGTGDLTMGTITMTGFSVDADGDTALKSLAVDDSSTIGCDSDTDLMTLSDGLVVVAGEMQVTTLDIGGTNVTSTAAELNKLDGAEVTTAEINILDGDTSASSVTIAAADRMILNDAGVMKQVDMDALEVYFESALDTLNSVTSATSLAAVGTITTGQFGTDGSPLSAYISGGELDGVTIGSESRAAAEFTTVSGSGNLSTQADLYVQGGSTLVGNVTVQGNLIVSGSKIIQSSSNLVVRDPLIGLGYAENTTGSAGDRGLLMGLAGENAATMFWDESESQFAFARTATVPSSSAVTVDSYADLRVNRLIGTVCQTISAFGDEDATLAAGFNYASADNTAARTLTLPASPTVGDVVYVKASSACSNTLTYTIERAGSQTIDGVNDIELQSPFAAVSLCYVASNLWRIF